MAQSNRYKNLYDYTRTAYSDTVTQYVNKNKELYTANLMYVTDVKDLKKQNEELYAEVKSLRDNPLVVTKIKTVYQIDTIAIEAPVTLDTANGNFESKFEYEDEWNSIFGRLNGNILNNTGVFTLDKLQFNCDITSDIIEKDGNLYFISKSNNPYLTITNTDGYMLSPEKSKLLKKRFNKPWGVMIGVGGTLTLYDNNVKFLPGINLTIGYKILSF
jgi:hypothetical protein